MNGRGIALLLAAALGLMMYCNSSESSSHTDKTWFQEQIDGLRLKIQKVEALVTLMKSETPIQLEEPLREHHLVPIHNVSQVAQPAPPPDLPIVRTQVITPGMEPAKQPPFAATVYQAPSGHYEYRGIRGRRSYWVSDQPQAQQYQVQQRQGVPVLRWFSGCRGRGCGS